MRQILSMKVMKRLMSWSLEEIPFMDDVRDPVWAEDDRRNEEYIKIHGSAHENGLRREKLHGRR